MYISLARKYRPTSFSEVIGQNVSKRILMNSIRMDRIISSMLITGIKGTGKTTLARIYAKALNCSNLIEGDVCNTCESCIEASNGTHPDIIEVDAASNNGVGFVRDLVGVINQIPSYSRRVFIFDEVHMFTSEAQAAFLKMFEEPPENVSFILVTTDPQKLVDTIRSRCLSMPLTPLNVGEVEESLKRVLEGENQPYTDDFLRGMSLLGEGSLRDVQQYIDQMIVAANGEALDSSYMEDYLGVVSVDQFRGLAGILCSLNLNYCIQSVQGWHNSGVDLKQLFLDGIPLFLRDCTLYLNGITEVPYLTGIPLEVFQERLTLNLEYIKFIGKCWEDLESSMRSTFHPKAIWSLFCVNICPTEGV